MTTITAYKLPTGLYTPGCPVQIGYTPEDGLDLPEMYQSLNCHLVTAVQSSCFPGLTVWCDDEALLRADPVLNLRASILAGQPVYGPVLIVSENRDGYCRSWSPDNPLPFVPCELDSLARRIANAVKTTIP